MNKMLLFSLFGVLVLSLIFTGSMFNISISQLLKDDKPYLGVNLSGYYTRFPEARNLSDTLPPNYFTDSFKILSEAGMNHIRFLIFWESYIKNPTEFINEIKTVANAADKSGIKVLYDNHQFHTSSYLNPQRGTGFPLMLFEGNSSYFYSGGGGTKYPAAKAWWTSWWDRKIKDPNGNDGWTMLSDFLKLIVSITNNHTSTIGYEILSEPQVHDKSQWEKIGVFNNFLVNKLREVTNKTLAYSMNIPIDLKSDIELNVENLVKMAPTNRENVVFKISAYGLPQENSYQSERLDLFKNTARSANVPLYIGEWNNIKREKIISEEGDVSTVINEQLSDINQTEANSMVKKFKELEIWGAAFWQWRPETHRVQNYNLIDTSTDEIVTTPYFDIVKNAYNEVYGK